MGESEKNPVKNPSVGWILSEIFSCAWNPFALASIAIPSAYTLIRDLAGERLGPKFDGFEKRMAKVTGFFHRHIPVIRRIPKEEFQRGQPGAALLGFGTIQIPTIAVMAALSLVNPSLAGWLTTAATAIFAASNIKFGLQLNHFDDDEASSPIANDARPGRRMFKRLFKRRALRNEMNVDLSETPQSKRHVVKEIATSPIVLDAIGTVFTAVVAGVTTSFGTFASIPIAISMASATLVAYDELSKSKLNTALPMLALAGVSVTTAISAALTHHLDMAAANACCAWGDVTFAAISHREFVDDRPDREPAGILDRLSYQLVYPRPTSIPTPQAPEPQPALVTLPMKAEAPKTASQPSSKPCLALALRGPTSIIALASSHKPETRPRSSLAQIAREIKRSEKPLPSPRKGGKPIPKIPASNNPTRNPDVAYAGLPVGKDWQHNAPRPPGLA